MYKRQGRIVYQDLAKINQALEKNTLRKKTVLRDCLEYAKRTNKKIHLLGLLSDGGVHSHIKHIEGFIDILEEYKLKEFYLHAFTDGRDVDPQSGIHFVESIEKKMLNTNGKLASLIGRYYAMDRDQRWERIKEAYDLLIHGKGEASDNFVSSLKSCLLYTSDAADES